MEKFYIVTEESTLRKDYFDYRENLKEINNLVKEFCLTHGIESTVYYATDEQLYIIPTYKDIANFDKVLGKEINGGLRPFKKTSKINKVWVKILTDKNLEILHRPYVGFYFNNCHGKYRSRLFDAEGTVYCSMNLLDYDILENPKGMIEIKASEFYKIIEEEDERIKNKTTI